MDGGTGVGVLPLSLRETVSFGTCARVSEHCGYA